MATRGDELEDRHNRGEQDAASGEYNSPGPDFLEQVMNIDEQNEKRWEDKAAYDKGYENNRSNR